MSRAILRTRPRLTDDKGMQLFTVSEVGEIYGISRQRVAQIAAERKIKGRRVGRMIAFTAAEVKQLKPGKPGRPRKDER